MILNIDKCKVMTVQSGISKRTQTIISSSPKITMSNPNIEKNDLIVTYFELDLGVFLNNRLKWSVANKAYAIFGTLKCSYLVTGTNFHLKQKQNIFK